MPSLDTRAARRTGRRAAAWVAASIAKVQHEVAGDTSVALTFDDGPDPVHTPLVLDELARLGVRATFFVVGGRARQHPRLVRRMLDEGHAVGSHSATHPDPWTLGTRELVDEYRTGRAHVEEVAGRPMDLFRPPKGHLDVSGALAVRIARLRPWLWTLDPEDWRPGVTADELVARLSTLEPGAVVLLHDGLESPLEASALDRTSTVAALDPVVRSIRDRGLHPVTLG